MPPKKKKRKLDENATESDVKESPAKRARKNNDDDGGDKEEHDLEESKAETKQRESKFNAVVLVPRKDVRDTDLVASLDKDLVCCICLQLMENPYSFPCGHSFCKGM
jgi:hypothetical protein